MSVRRAADTAQYLRNLLDELNKAPPPATIFVFARQPFTAAVVHMIGQYQRISRRSRDDLLIGLNEFHIALCYLSWQQFDTAETHFRKASFRWLLANLTVFHGLAEFALALTQHHALHFEDAMITFQSASRTVGNELETAARGQTTSPRVPLGALQRFYGQMEAAQLQLQEDLKAMWTPAGLRRPALDDPPTEPTAVTPVLPSAPAETMTVARPMISPDLLREPVEPRSAPSEGRDGAWFRVIARLDEFLPDVRTGDWLLVGTAGQAPQPNGFVVVSGQIEATIRVAPAQLAPAGVDYHLVQFVRAADEDSVMLLPNSRRQLLNLSPETVIGPVLGFWREAERIE